MPLNRLSSSAMVCGVKSAKLHGAAPNNPTFNARTSRMGNLPIPSPFGKGIKASAWPRKLVRWCFYLDDVILGASVAEQLWRLNHAAVWVTADFCARSLLPVRYIKTGFFWAARLAASSDHGLYPSFDKNRNHRGCRIISQVIHKIRKL